MSFNPKNPIYSPEVSSDPSSPPAGTRGLYPKSDGWYDINGDGFTEKIVGKSYVDEALEEEALQRKSADDSKVDKVKGCGVGHVLTLIGHGKEWSQVAFVSGSPNDRVKIPAYTSDLENDSGFADKTSVDEINVTLGQKADKTIVDEINVTLEQNSEALSVLKQRSIPHTTASGYPLTVTDHLEGEEAINYQVYGNSVQDGTPTPETPIEIQSVGDLVTDEASEYYGKYDIPINICGKNLFSGLTKGIGIHNANGSEITDKKYTASGYIPVDLTVNNNYHISGLPSTISNYIAAYNENKEFLGRTGGSAVTERILTTKAFTSGTAQGTGDIAYLRICVFVTSTTSGTIDDIDDCKIQLEKGSTATEYEPYSGETKHIYLDEPLGKVGDYADYIDYGNQKVIRQVEVLDSTGAKTIDESLGVLDTPTEESITIPELTTPISSVANVSTFTTIKPSNMEVTYYQDINKKIAELQAAITALGGI